MRGTQGVSIIEMLIAMAIMGLIMVSFSQIMFSSSDLVSTNIDKSNLIEDSRGAGNIIADSFARAAYIYPPGVNLQLGTDYTLREPGLADGNSWINGTDPMIAMIQPAPLPGNPCNHTVVGDDGCMVFVAYYAVRRDVVVANATGPNALPQGKNDNLYWTIFELRRKINAQRFSSASPQPPGTIRVPFNDLRVAGNVQSSAMGNMLADYILPNNAAAVPPVVGFQGFFGDTTNWYCQTSTGAKAACTTLSPTALDFRATATRASLQLTSGAPADRNPSSTASYKIDPMRFTITPRNLY